MNLEPLDRGVLIPPTRGARRAVLSTDSTELVEADLRSLTATSPRAVRGRANTGDRDDDA
ncbi:hypothetical protein [Halobaculum limi]|uniref:hypothetical protein n=1 Tax=Halobaculum limi TaxID=3031916 RepID=UPI002406D677|nr:hypothetical protein [Halobaculum sp. YSMS11]